MIHPIVIDETTRRRLWLACECADHCGVETTTWRSYARADHTMNPPKPVARIGNSPLWDPEEVIAWHAARPGSPVRKHSTQKRQHPAQA